MAGATTAKDIPGIIAPPPLLYLGGLVLGLVLDRFVSLGAVSGFPAGGIAIAISGAVLMGLGIREFKRVGTDFRPYKSSTRIIASGPFRFTRNPLYLSMTLIYLGIAIAAGSTWAFLLLVPVLIVIHHGVIAREERYLEGKFGGEYLRYKGRVRRWI